MLVQILCYQFWSSPKKKHSMGLSENSVLLNPMVLLIIIPIKWLFYWEYTQHFQTNPYVFSKSKSRASPSYPRDAPCAAPKRLKFPATAVNADAGPLHCWPTTWLQPKFSTCSSCMLAWPNKFYCGWFNGCFGLFWHVWPATKRVIVCSKPSNLWANDKCFTDIKYQLLGGFVWGSPHKPSSMVRLPENSILGSKNKVFRTLIAARSPHWCRSHTPSCPS